MNCLAVRVRAARREFRSLGGVFSNSFLQLSRYCSPHANLEFRRSHGANVVAVLGVTADTRSDLVPADFARLDAEPRQQGPPNPHGLVGLSSTSVAWLGCFLANKSKVISVRKGSLILDKGPHHVADRAIIFFLEHST